MKADITTKIYKKAFDVTEDHTRVNNFLKAIVLEMNGKTYVVYNDNFGTRRKYADFTKGKRATGLHPLQIVFSGVDMAKIFHTKYIDADDKLCAF